MSIKNIILKRFLRSKKIFGSLKPSRKLFNSLWLYLFRDKIRLLIFLLAIDLLAAFYIFNNYVLPVISGGAAVENTSTISEKVEVKKDLYNEVIKQTQK